jgi:DNA-binding MurR/RpiR family transcriptional regulator
MATSPDLAALSDRITERYEALSPQLRNAARYLLDHPDDVALRSMRDIAETAGLPAVTFVRLTRALGFRDYAELRQVFQNRLRRGPDGVGFSAKARDLQRRGGGDSAATLLLKEVFGAEIDNIELTFEKNHPGTVERAVDLVEHADRVLLLGQRSCHAPAFFFHYVYRLFRANAVLVVPPAIDALRGVGRRDLLLVISIAPYSAEAVETARYAREEGAQILAITDDALSPVARVADASLLVAAATPSFFHSMASTMALVQALLALLVARGGKDALAAIEASEQLLERFNAYWVDDNPRRRSR